MSVMSELDIDRQEMELFFLPADPEPCTVCFGDGVVFHDEDHGTASSKRQSALRCLHCDGTGYETEET